MAYEDDDQSFEALFSQAESNSITFEPQNVTDLMSTSSNRDFSRYVEEQENSVGKPKMIGCIPEVDLNIKEFRPIEKYFNEEPNQIYDDPSYYKKCLTGEGQSSQRLHGLLVKYLNCQDKKDKTVYRQQIVTAYWEFLRTLAPKMASTGIPDCKRMAMRFGILLPSLATPEQKTMFAKSIDRNNTYEPVLYMDEWIKSIALGHMKPSATDEAPVKGGNKGPGAEQARLQQLKSKNSGKIQTSESLLNAKESERQTLEAQVKNRMEELFVHESVIGFEPHKAPYTDLQRKMFSDITNLFRSLQKVDKELTNYLNDFKEAKGIEDSLNAKSGEIVEEVSVGKEEILGEMNTLRQMQKMTCGRQGNQFPVFTREFFHCIDKFTGFRENVIRELQWIESIDPQCFCRIHKNIPHRIVPYTLLVPSYGDSGFCWEPFDRFNRLSSRGRICIPMYPRDLKTACLTAVADLRWQVAKEKASFDWMSDGLTGHYYQYLEEHKMKGDIKQFFIDDYILWMTKEANGTQKLDKEVRAIFWRYIPFPQELKEELKKRSLAYAELFQRDINRSMSDGY
ncbi:hypothetical protein [Treponema sp.]|uniref:hypothetical protein n=1 Tax=Treponema sp. TaxID=166 RepID=UPI001E0AA09D|nr:hypothetical protein [Treponema sp.]MBS7241000.1 hypothetical protein [Treponema sp.]MCI6442397.1 hypothetical protein [Spirochaetia bacterium]MDY4132063.1 hypothetical protein [Treponema sp.]